MEIFCFISFRTIDWLSGIHWFPLAENYLGTEYLGY